MLQVLTIFGNQSNFKLWREQSDFNQRDFVENVCESESSPSKVGGAGHQIIKLDRGWRSGWRFFN